MPAQDYPHLTVATVVERQGRFLIVEEREDGKLVLNQPAGHVESGETLVEAARRETLEETGWTVELFGLLGAVQYRAVDDGISYCRISFVARALQQKHPSPPDPEVLACHWLRAEDIAEQSARLRSPLVLSTLRRYLDGRVFPLEFLY